MTIKFTTDQLMGGLLTDFKYGRDIKIQFHGKMVNSTRSGGCFTQMDFNGAPTLSTEFVEYMDGNDSGVIPYGATLEAFTALQQADPQAAHALEWYIFERSPEKDQMWLADKLGYTDRTIRRLKKRGLAFLADSIVKGVKTVQRPFRSDVFLSA